MSAPNDVADPSAPLIFTPYAAAAPPPPVAHLVQFYEDEEVLTASVGRFLGEGMAAGDLLTVIATEPHTETFRRRLETEGIDVERACASGQLAFLDAHETLARFMRDGEPERHLFESTVGHLMATRIHDARTKRVRAYGEMVDVLWRRGQRTAAIRLEELWNDLQRRHAFTLLCAYGLGGFYKEPAALHSVCGTHTHVLGEGRDGARDPVANPTAPPPQYVDALTREIAQREEVEAALRESLHDLRRKEEQLTADIAERKTFERFRADAAGRAERLVKITAAVADAVTTDEVFAALVDNLAASVDASSAGLWLIDDDGDTVRLARSVGYRTATGQEFHGLSLASAPPIPVLDCVRRRAPIWIPSQDALVRDYPHLQASVTPGRSYRISCLPLISHGRTLGALGLTIEDARETTEDERDFLLLVARYAGQAIERLRLLDAERRSRAEADAAAARLGVLSRASRTFVDADLDLGPGSTTSYASSATSWEAASRSASWSPTDNCTSRRSTIRSRKRPRS